jgi:CheY-like chemotaxis protein
MTILIVDDNPRFRAMIRAVIASLDPDIHECGDGVAAVDAYPRLRPRLVLMDVRMPRLDGLGATQAIRESDRDARIVVLTDYDDHDIRRAAIAAGARAYLSKEHLLRLPEVIGDLLADA